MFEISFNIGAFERAAERLNVASYDQVPFAVSQALNQAVVNTRRVLTESTWPEHVTVRNRAFIGRALQTKFATKRDLRVAIFEDASRTNGRANLLLHADGGTKRPLQGQLAIPPKGLFRRGPKGISQGNKPKAIIAKTPKRSLRITSKGIFVGKGGRLQLMYAFKPSARQPADVPFRQDFYESMMRDVRAGFPNAMSNALRTALRGR